MQTHSKMEAASDLERAWFNCDLDHFCAQRVRLSGYKSPTPGPHPAIVFLMRQMQSSELIAARRACIMGGTGSAATGLCVAWELEEDLHLHCTGKRQGSWHQSFMGLNLLCLGWIGSGYGDGGEFWSGQNGIGQMACLPRLPTSPNV